MSFGLLLKPLGLKLDYGTRRINHLQTYLLLLSTHSANLLQYIYTSRAFSFVNRQDVKISWFHKKKEIKQSEFFRISQFDDSCQLEISRVYPEDEGEYTCMATNNGGTVSCSATLTFDGEFNTKKKGCFSYSETIEGSITEAHSSAGFRSTHSH